MVSHMDLDLMVNYMDLDIKLGYMNVAINIMDVADKENYLMEMVVMVSYIMKKMHIQQKFNMVCMDIPILQLGPNLYVVHAAA